MRTRNRKEDEAGFAAKTELLPAETELHLSHPNGQEKDALTIRPSATKLSDAYREWIAAPEGAQIPELTEHKFMDWAKYLREDTSKFQWKTVEFIFAARDQHGEGYVQIAEATGLSIDRIQVLMSVGEACIGTRRRLLQKDKDTVGIPFGIFEVVAAKTRFTDEQRDVLVYDAAFAHKMSRDQFREYVDEVVPPKRQITSKGIGQKTEDAIKDAEKEEEADRNGPPLTAQQAGEAIASQLPKHDVQVLRAETDEGDVFSQPAVPSESARMKLLLALFEACLELAQAINNKHIKMTCSDTGEEVMERFYDCLNDVDNVENPDADDENPFDE